MPASITSRDPRGTTRLVTFDGALHPWTLPHRCQRGIASRAAHDGGVEIDRDAQHAASPLNGTQGEETHVAMVLIDLLVLPSDDARHHVEARHV